MQSFATAEQGSSCFCGKLCSFSFTDLQCEAVLMQNKALLVFVGSFVASALLICSVKLC